MESEALTCSIGAITRSCLFFLGAGHVGVRGCVCVPVCVCGRVCVFLYVGCVIVLRRRALLLEAQPNLVRPVTCVCDRGRCTVVPTNATVGQACALQCAISNNTASTKTVVVGMTGGDAFAIAGVQSTHVAILPSDTTVVRWVERCARIC